MAIWYFSSPPHIILPALGVRGAAVVEQSRVTPHEGDGQLLEELLHHCSLLLPILPGQGAAQFLHFCYGSGVPRSKALSSDRDELYSLTAAKICRIYAFFWSE